MPLEQKSLLIANLLMALYLSYVWVAYTVVYLYESLQTVKLDYIRSGTVLQNVLGLTVILFGTGIAICVSAKLHGLFLEVKRHMAEVGGFLFIS